MSTISDILATTGFHQDSTMCLAEIMFNKSHVRIMLRQLYRSKQIYRGSKTGSRRLLNHRKFQTATLLIFCCKTRLQRKIYLHSHFSRFDLLLGEQSVLLCVASCRGQFCETSCTDMDNATFGMLLLVWFVPAKHKHYPPGCLHFQRSHQFACCKPGFIHQYFPYPLPGLNIPA